MVIYLFALLFIFYLMSLNKIIIDYGILKEDKIGDFTFWLYTTYLILFSGFRFNIGWDYQAYYETIISDVQTNIILNGEELTILLIQLSKLLDDYRFFFIANSFITIFLIAYIIKKYSRDPWIGILLFVSFPLFFLNSLSIIRFFTALAITFFAFHFLVKDKYIKYIVTIFIASMFHNSALIALVFILLKKINLRRLYIVGIIFSLPVIKIFFIFVIENFFPGYVIYLQNDASQAGTKAILIVLLLAIMILFYKSKIEFQDPIIKLANKLFLFGTMIYILFMDQGVLGHRLSLYGTIYMLIIVPKIVASFKGIERLAVYLFVIILSIAMYVYIIIVSGETYIPYKTVFFN